MPHKTLILAPNPDDEIFWCYTFLNPNSKVIIATVTPNLDTSVEILDELRVPWECYEYRDLHLCDAKSDLIERLEHEIDVGGYDSIVYPCTSSHQDHQTMHDVMRIVTRPKHRRFHFLYEYPYWNDGMPVYNCFRAAPPDKITAMHRFPDCDAWSRYIEAMNAFVAAHNCRPGICEPFNLIWSDCL